MKKISSFIIFSLFIILIGCNQKKHENYFGDFLEKDYGYISKKIGIEILKKLNEKQKINLHFLDLKKTDTIGKYYKKDNYGNYIFFITDVINEETFPSYYLLEINKDGEILQKEKYYSVYNPCCWNNYYNTLGKKNNFYYLKDCGSGSGFCSTQYYIFKEITPQKKLNPIIINSFCGMCELQNNKIIKCLLSSKVDFKNDSLIVHYSLIKKTETQTLSSHHFNVKYYQKDNFWRATDSTEIKKLCL